MKNKKKKIIFVACDTSNLKQIKKIINQTKSNELDIIPKFGMQFYGGNLMSTCLGCDTIGRQKSQSPILP